MLWISFSLALFAVCFGTALIPTVKLLAFAPLFAMVYMRKSLLSSLWIALACGMIVDLLISAHRFGATPLMYCLTTFTVYHQKRHFFEDKPLAFSLFTALISFVYTGINLLAILFSEKNLPLSGQFFFTEFVGIPFLDALYAFFWFTCPLKLYAHLKQRFSKRRELEEEPKADMR